MEAREAECTKTEGQNGNDGFDPGILGHVGWEVADSKTGEDGVPYRERSTLGFMATKAQDLTEPHLFAY